MTPLAPPSFADIEAAAQRLQGYAVRTPLLEVPALNAASGGRILLKAEPLQRTGSFKFRGAFNFLSCIAPDIRAKGVVAYSSGNHAQGVAAAAQVFGVPATIVMPSDAPRMKVENTEGYGAHVVCYDRMNEDREAIAAAIAAQSGSTLVPPYDHPWTIAGQGTIGLEIAAQCAALGAEPDMVLVCCGGGGLSAGIAIALAEQSPNTRLMTVEPAGFDDTRRSLETGERVSNAKGTQSICDALLSPTPGELTFSIMMELGLKGLAVSDTEVRTAIAYAWRHLKVVLEPGGAVTLAAILSGKLDCAGKTIAATLSGGNVDAATFRESLEVA
jgi:threonine dehydratase